MKILIVEDEKALLEGIAHILYEEKYYVDTAMNGFDGLLLAKQNIYDAIILDIMLPELDGFSVCKSLRENSIKTPILLLTAKDSVEDRVKGLDFGADDYLIKPFAAPELLARIRVLLRGKGDNHENELIYGPIKLNEQERDGYIYNQKLQLTIKEYLLLEFLIRNKEQILLRDQIFNRIWGFSSDTGLNVVDVYVHHLRKKMGTFHGDHFIKTVRGIGFMLKGDDEDVQKN
ncbi:response regulator transcription factor [Neobacillus ginsengisoli]|uniref:DNA-binding response OmpR family regulator n=1 Tax=Neobacillus ginsengisoli TaxID=904295 RepID=A0ABT9XQP4_9BACI|nr:response regulator transcription factor [Neobacillus ginsengisoli]MDQ0197831.1 DNA-binding response OmpR family regulator [Neobacillus ginsengisoli]